MIYKLLKSLLCVQYNRDCSLNHRSINKRITRDYIGKFLWSLTFLLSYFQKTNSITKYHVLLKMLSTILGKITSPAQNLQNWVTMSPIPRDQKL